MEDQNSDPAEAEEQSIARAVAVLSGTVRSIVTVPDQVRVEAKTIGRVTTLLLSVSPDDASKFHEQGERTARSLRTLINALSVRSALDMRLEIVVKTS